MKDIKNITSYSLSKDRGKIIFSTLLIFILTNVALKAQDYKLSIISTNKLSHLSVQCIEKDSTGFMWIGTKDGLNRYDGYEYVEYKYNPKNVNSISNNEISSLAVQGDTILWIGTRGGGVNRLGLKDGKIKRYSYESFDGFIRDVIVDKNKTVWVGTTVGLLKYNTQDDVFVNVTEGAVFRYSTNESFIPGDVNIRIKHIYPYSDKVLIVAAETGIFEYDIESGCFRMLSRHLRWIDITTNIVEDNQGNLWISNYDGLLKLQPEKNKKSFTVTTYNSQGEGAYHLKSDRVNDVVVDKKGNIWFAIDRVGLALIRDNKIIYYNDLINSDQVDEVNVVNDLYYDGEDLIWIGTENSALHAIDLSENPFNILSKNSEEGYALKMNRIKSLAGRNNKLLVGKISGEIEHFEIVDGQLEFKKSILLPSYKGVDMNRVIRSLLIDDNDNVWIGSSINSLIQYHTDGSSSFSDLMGYIFTLMEDRYQNIWYGTWQYGFGFVDSSTGELEKFTGSSKEMLGLSNSVVLSIMESKDGFLLIGTKGGGLNIASLDKVVNRSTTFDVYRHNPDVKFSIAHNDIYKIFETQNGDIWLGTGRGLVKLVPPSGETLKESLKKGTINFIEVTEDDGLPGGIVYSISEDQNGYLWLGTNRGLCRYSEQESNIIEFNPNGSEMPQSYENNAVYFDKENKLMFFGGLNSVVYFNPDSVVPKRYNLPVYFTNFSILNQSINPGKEYNGRVILENDIAFTKTVKLKYSEKLLSFEFSSLLTNSLKDKTRYKYRLLGFNDNWIEKNEQDRKVSFTNLKPGNYTLQVKAANSDGSWANNASELYIIIKPPFWLTPWAYALYLGLILFLLLVFRKYSVIRIKEKNLLHIQEIEHRKEVEISDAKIRFFTNVSHEIRTPLTLIYEPLKQLSSNNEIPEGSKELIGMVMRNMKRLLNQVNRLLELRKMDDGEYVIKYSNISVKELISKIMYEFEVAIKSKNIEVQYNVLDNIHIQADRQLLDTVIYNLVSNAIKFLPQENGLIEFSAVTNKEDETVEPGKIRISVADNGPGIPEVELKNVFDYFYQTKGVEQSNIGGTGIGLAIVKEYIDYHSGSVSVINLDKGGCRFDILLPMNTNGKDIVKEEVPFNASVDKKTKNKPNTYADYLKDVTGDRILNMVIVEDDVDLANYLRRIFKIQFSITHFAEGQGALDNISEIMPDIIITDLMMPNINGLELTEKLKQNKETSHIPVVMLTAKSEDESKIQGLKYGADSYLTKPFNTEVLVAQVGAIIKSRSIFKDRFSKNLILEPTESVIVPAEEKFIKKIMELTEARLDDPTFEVPDIVGEMGMSHSLLLRKFKAITGMSLVEFVRSMRIKKAEQLFKQDKFTVAEVAYKVGFSDPKYFSKCFANEVGMRPSVYIKKHHV